MIIKENEPLAPKTTFEIGGNARYFAEVATLDDVAEVRSFARQQSLPVFVIGGGSNLLVSDDGYPGVVIQVKNESITMGNNIVSVGAGMVLWDFIRETAAMGLSGLERLTGIPGTIGGAIRGNAGAFGSEIKDAIREVEAYNLKSGELQIFTPEECEFAYRTSFFKTRSEWIVWRARLFMASGVPDEITRKCDDVVKERQKRHLQTVRSAGSFFANPVAPEAVCRQFSEEKGQECRGGRVPAGWMVDKCGLKGLYRGGAIVSDDHADHIINERNATAQDVCILAGAVRAKVREDFGVELVPEACLLNCELEDADIEE